jgi:hypothetical protein
MITHEQLCIRAEKWLKTKGCGVVFRDGFRAIVHSGEQPDAIGWRDGISILVECKTSRADFHAEKSKRFRADPLIGMGDWRFYLCEPGLIRVDDLPPGWGLLYAHPRRIEVVAGVPKGNCNWWNKPFSGNKLCENQMMYSALRRMVLRGHFESIYERLV